MKKFAAGILTALCATAIATAQPIDQPIENAPQAVSTQAAPAQVAQQAIAPEAQNNEAAPIDEQQQTVSAPKKNAIGFGARASFIYGNFWGFKDMDDLDAPSGFGADFGVAAHFPITNGLTFTPEIAFRLFYLDHGDDDYTRNFDMTFLDFAFYVRGAITKTFYLEVGPQLSINTSGDYTIENQSGAYDNFENIEQTPVEFGINIGLGYNVLDNLSVGFRWYMGFNEVFPDVKYLDELGPEDYDGSKIKHGVKCSISNLKGAHTMMFKLGITYWFI